MHRSHFFIFLVVVALGGAIGFSVVKKEPRNSRAEEATASANSDDTSTMQWLQLGHETSDSTPEVQQDDENSCTSECRMVFAPSPAPAAVTPSVAVGGVPDSEIITDERCGDVGGCLLLLNLEDKDKNETIEPREQYVLTPHTVGETETEVGEIQWVASLNQRNVLAPYTARFVLLGAMHSDPNHPLLGGSLSYIVPGGSTTSH